VYSPIVVQAAQERLEQGFGRELRRATVAECEEMAFRMKDIQWDPQTGAPDRPLAPDMEEFIFVNRLLSKIDFEYFLTHFCKILTDEKKLQTIIPWPSQQRVLDALAKEEERQMDATSCKIPIVLLKSRQVGGTVIGEALIAHLVFLNANTQGLIASDHPDMSLKLYQTLTRMYDNLPGWLRPYNEGRVKGTHLHFPKLDSDVIVGAGNQKTTLGQGMNIDIAHLTELSTWEFPKYIDEDLMPAFNSSRKHHSVILFESTGAGARGNWFHDHFMAAWKGETTHKAIFAAWYLRPTNRLNAEGLEWKEHTLNMAERVKKENDLELDREQLAYYQITRQDFEAKGELEKFYQEFPSTVEEAFQTGMRSVFPIEVRSRLRDACEPPLAVFNIDLDARKLRRVRHHEWLRSEDADKWDNRLALWELPKPECTYAVAVDASWGIDGGDNCAIEVLKVGTARWRDQQVAEFCGNLDPLALAKVVWIVANVFYDKENEVPALTAVETNPGNPGLLVQNELMRMNHPNLYIYRKPEDRTQKFQHQYGFPTTPRTRPIITDTFKAYVMNDDIVLRSSKFVEEMGYFVDLPLADGRLKHHLAAAPGYHDDRIMALAIALYVSHEMDVINIADERRRRVEARRRLKANPTKPKQLWEVMATMVPGEGHMTWEELQDKALDDAYAAEYNSDPGGNT